MREHRNPQNNGMCPFYVVPDDPLSASASVDQCVACVTHGNAVLDGLRNDFRQTAYLTILEETPEYDPCHSSRASFITFIKSRVCGSLWSQRRQEMKHLPFADTEVSTSEESENLNPLAVYLYAQACEAESLEDSVIRKIEVEELRARLPEMLSRLTPKERKLIDLKYFKERTGVQIAKNLGISPGRVSQLTKTAHTKLQKAYVSVFLEQERPHER